MAEIPRALIQNRERGSVAVSGGVPSLPASPRVTIDTGAEALGVAAIGQEISQIGGQLLQIGEQRRRERDATEVANAYGRGVVGLEELRLAIETNPDIKPEERASTYLDQANQFLEKQLETVRSEAGKAQLRSQLGTRIAGSLGGVSTRGQAEFQQEKAELFSFLIEQARNELVATDDPDERAAIMQGIRRTAAGMVESGALSQTTVTAGLVALQEGEQIQRMNLLIGADPHQSERHLLRLSKGEEGIEGFPDVPVDEIAGLLRVARSARRNIDQDERRDEQAIEREEAERQSARAIELRSRLYETNATVETHREVIRLASAEAQRGNLDEDSHAAIVRTATVLIDAHLRSGVISDTEILNALTLEIFGESLPPSGYRALRQDVEGALASGLLNRKDAVPLLQALNSRSRADHYSSVPEYKEGVRFIQQAVGVSDVSLTNPLDDPLREVRLRAAQAVVAYNQVMGEIFQRGGRNAVAKTSQQVADEIVETFGVSPSAQLSKFPFPEELRGLSGTIDEKYRAAFRRLEAQDMPDELKAAKFRVLKQRRELERQEEARLGGPSVRGAGGASRSGTPILETLKNFITDTIGGILGGEEAPDATPPEDF